MSSDRQLPQMRSAVGWVPAIPEPLRAAWWRVQCPECDSRFRSRLRFREHYALHHILGTP